MDVIGIRQLQVGIGAWQERCEYLAKGIIDRVVGRLERLVLAYVQLFDLSMNLLFIREHLVLLLDQLSVVIFCLFCHLINMHVDFLF